MGGWGLGEVTAQVPFVALLAAMANLEVDREGPFPDATEPHCEEGAPGKGGRHQEAQAGQTSGNYRRFDVEAFSFSPGNNRGHCQALAANRPAALADTALRERIAALGRARGSNRET